MYLSPCRIEDICVDCYAIVKMNSLLAMLANYCHSASHCHVTSVMRLGEIEGAATARDAGDVGVGWRMGKNTTTLPLSRDINMTMVGLVRLQ